MSDGQMGRAKRYLKCAEHVSKKKDGCYKCGVYNEYGHSQIECLENRVDKKIKRLERMIKSKRGKNNG